MQFYERFVALCRERGSSPAAVAREIGLSNSATTAWKKGARPKYETIERLSEFFGISANELLDTGDFPLPTDDPNRRYGINNSIDSASATPDYLTALGLRFSHITDDLDFPDIDGGFELITNVRNNTACIVPANEIDVYVKHIESYANFEISELFSKAKRKYVVDKDGTLIET